LLAFKHFWIAFILVTFANGAAMWRQSKPYREVDPSLSEGYRSLVRGFVVWGNIPWLIMGAGILFGGVPSIFHFFNPRSPNPFVTAWFGSIIVLWIACSHWLFLRGGAEQLARHPGFTRPPITNPSTIKLLWLVCMGGGILGFVAMYLAEFTPPEF